MTGLSSYIIVITSGLCELYQYIKHKAQEGQPNADFIQITAWRNTAEFVGKYFHKGQQVLIEGYLRNNNWTDKDGNKRYSDEVHAEQVYFADSKRDSGSNNTFGGGNMSQAPQSGFQGQKPENGDGFYALSEEDEDLLNIPTR